MTVAELIAILQTKDQGAIVVAWQGGEMQSWYEIDATDVREAMQVETFNGYAYA